MLTVPKPLFEGWTLLTLTLVLFSTSQCHIASDSKPHFLIKDILNGANKTALKKSDISG